MQTHTNPHLHHVEETSSKEPPRNSSPSFLSLFVLGLTVLVALGGVFLAWQKYSLVKANIEITQKIETKLKTIQGLAKGSDVASYKTAAQALSKAESYRVKWSDIAAKILKLESPRIQFVQFSSSPKKEISIQGVASSMEDVSRLIGELKKNPEIKEPFVSSIAEQGENGTFGFQLTFLLVNPS